jgi:hypothetical protein
MLTQVVEIPIYRQGLRQGFWASFGASAITHPLVWLFLASHVCGAPWKLQLAAAELFAWLTEAAYFRFGFGCRQALVWTLVANGSSFMAGIASRTLLDIW